MKLSDIANLKVSEKDKPVLEESSNNKKALSTDEASDIWYKAIEQKPTVTTPEEFAKRIAASKTKPKTKKKKNTAKSKTKKMKAPSPTEKKRIKKEDAANAQGSDQGAVQAGDHRDDQTEAQHNAHTNAQTGVQASVHIDAHRDDQAMIQADTQYSAQADVQTADQDSVQTSVRPKDQGSAHREAQGDAHGPIQGIAQGTDHRDNQANAQAPAQTPMQALKQTPMQAPENTIAMASIPASDESTLQPVPLSPNEMILYLCIKKLNGSFSTLNHLSEKTGIPYGSIRRYKYNLVNQHLINFESNKNLGMLKGFYATLTDVPAQLLCTENEAIAFRETFQKIDFSDLSIIKKIDLEMLDSDQNKSSSYVLSSKESSKKTTTDEIKKILATHSELKYWVGKGINPGKVQDWMQEFDQSLQSIVRSLCHGQFELTDLGKEKSIPVKSPLGWFHGTLKKTGGIFPEPKGYMSFEAKELEKEQKESEERKKKLEELRTIRAKKEEEEFELRFEQMMADPAGELFRECEAMLDDFARRRKGTGTFDIAMKAALEKIEDR